MNRIKLNTGLASIILVASIFAGWQTLLLVTLLMFMFCDVEEKVKDVAVRVITFYVGYYIVSLGWDVITKCASLLTQTITSFVTTFNSYVDPVDYLVATKITAPISLIVNIVDGIVSIMFVLVKIGFVISVLTGKPSSSNALLKKINEYVSKAVNYVNGVVVSNPVQANTPVTPTQVVPVAPVNQATNPVQPVTPAPSVSPVQQAVPGQSNVQNNNINNQQ